MQLCGAIDTRELYTQITENEKELQPNKRIFSIKLFGEHKRKTNKNTHNFIRIKINSFV